MVGRSLVGLVGIALHSVVDCERIRDCPVVTVVVRRGWSGFEKIGCLLAETKASIHIDHSFHVHSREQILAQLKAPAR